MRRHGADHMATRAQCTHGALVAATTQPPERPNLLQTRDANRRLALCRRTQRSIYKLECAIRFSCCRHDPRLISSGRDGSHRRRLVLTHSIVRHEALSERFIRRLAAAHGSPAAFGPDDLNSFFVDLDHRYKSALRHT